jgi:lipopolysaccharide/colanic/teichoic acid biosynthesis glycosyltransferase
VTAVASRPKAAAGLRRAFDVVLAGSALIVLSPVLLLCLVAVLTTSRGPAIFAQKRVGLGERTFRMYKLRTMRHRCDDAVHRAYVTRLLTESRPPTGGEAELYKLQGDARVTRVGRLLRRTSLDELPQLLNVVKGDMAIVGPRPALPYEVPLYDDRHRVRFDVRPGITGLWQVSGRGRLTMREALDLDVEYVEQRRFGLDVQIMLRTVPALFGKGDTS